MGLATTGLAANGGAQPLQWWSCQENFPLYTMPRAVSINGTTVSSGTGYGGIAVAMSSTTVTKMAFGTNGSSPSTLTDLYLAVCDSSGNALAQTSDVHASVTSANTLYTPDASPGTQIAGLALTSSLAITAGTIYYLALYWKGTTLGIVGNPLKVTAQGGAIGPSPALNRINSSYAGGSTLPQLTTTAGSAVMPWIIAY